MNDHGRIKAILPARGYGFLVSGDQDYFFHISDCETHEIFFELDVGDPVDFEVVEPQPAKGPRATNVRVVERNPTPALGEGATG